MSEMPYDINGRKIEKGHRLAVAHRVHNFAELHVGTVLEVINAGERYGGHVYYKLLMSWSTKDRKSRIDADPKRILILDEVSTAS